MMIHHFNCPPRELNKSRDAPLVFDWDDETGEITGPSAGLIHDAFRTGYVDIHPRPASHDLTSTKNKADLAAIIGNHHVIPADLAEFYPAVEDADWDGAIYDEAGNVAGYVQF
jgi:hypothetical protein